MRVDVFDLVFVDAAPERPSVATLYVSIRYASAIHLCACGCGRKVVTPLSPHDWRLIFDGDTVSLYPSVGNWSFPCQSHYGFGGTECSGPEGCLQTRSTAPGRGIWSDGSASTVSRRNVTSNPRGLRVGCRARCFWT